MTATPTAGAPRGYRTVEVPETRRADLVEVDRLAFPSGPDPDADAAGLLALDWTRTMGLADPTGTLAGIHASYPFSLPVPGSSVPCAGLTWVAVRPDHRRRGLLSSMLSTHFDRSLARGEPVSALFAAEAAIYGRFGYGSAAADLHLTLARGAGLRAVPGSAELELRLETADPAAHDDLVRTVHHAAGAGRPGWIERATHELRTRHLADPPSERRTAEVLRIVTVRDGAAVRGYALFRRTEHWVDGAPRGAVAVKDLAAVDGAAAHRLWSFLLDLDLMTSVESPSLAVDDALLQLLLDPRGARPRVADNLWLRLLDVPAALGARRYAAPVDVVLEITDELVPANAGRWHVRVDGPAAGDENPGAGAAGLPAEVSATAAAADLTLDVRDLAAAYLGGRSLAALARAGLVTEHRPGALRGASAAFGWPLAPLCSWAF